MNRREQEQDCSSALRPRAAWKALTPQSDATTLWKGNSLFVVGMRENIGSDALCTILGIQRKLLKTNRNREMICH